MSAMVKAQEIKINGWLESVLVTHVAYVAMYFL